MEISKNRREQESRMHDSLFRHISLLNHFYPPSKDLQRVLKPDMFIKKNKAAFIEVSFYLLNVYDPVNAKQKLKSYPPFNSQRETQYRVELLSYISEINNECEYANIPMPMASHLIAPGGYKFTRFMFKICQVVMHKHVLGSGANILNLPEISKHESVNKAALKNLKSHTMAIKNETKEMLNAFDKYYNEMSERAKGITEKITHTDKHVSELKDELKKTEDEFNSKHPSYPSMESLEEKLTNLKEKFNSISHVTTIFEECDKLMTHLKDNKCVLEHNDEFKDCSDPDLQNFSDKSEIDLIEFFKCFNNLLDKSSIMLSAPSEALLEKAHKEVDDLTKKYEQLLKSYEESSNELTDMMEETKKMFDGLKLYENSME